MDVPTQGYFSRVELRDDPQTLKALARGAWNGYRLHQALWRLFGTDGARRDFLYRAVDGSGERAFYVVSARPPRPVDVLWRVRAKDFAPRLAQGERLAFALRANPVVTRRAAPDASPTRHDVVMDARRQGSRAHDDPRGYWYLPGLDWLDKRAEGHGFRVERVAIDGYRQHRLFKPRRPHDEAIRFSTLDFDGILTVTDPDRLLQTLFAGIGPAKAFGCGLLLVRRV